MATIIKEWSSGSISVAVEAGKDDMNREGPMCMCISVEGELKPVFRA